ncbi:MAG: hypothetical protein J5938_01980 [Clostridia bacterium]|nr:hypothetical protein [Clostridia bacterium]
MENPKGKKNPIFSIMIWGGVILCILSYVFTSTTGQLIPALTPFSLLTAIVGYTLQHYADHKENKDGMLRPQMIILCAIGVIPLVLGIMEIVALFAG